MFENLTYKQKFFTLIILSIVLGLTAYKRSFKLTIDAYQNFKLSKDKLRKVDNSWQRVGSLESEVGFLDDIIGRNATNSDIVQQEILTTFSNNTYSTDLIKLEEVHKANNDYFNIYTNSLLLSGEYNNVLRKAYDYEKNFDYSRLVSLNLYSTKELRSRKLKLYCQLIFQNYEKIP